MEPCLVSWKVMRMNAKASRWKNEISQKQNTATEWLLSLLSSLLQLLALDVNQEVAGLEEPVDENRHAVEEDRGWEGERDKHALAVKVLLLRIELVVRSQPLVSPLSRRDGRHWKDIMTPSSIQEWWTYRGRRRWQPVEWASLWSGRWRHWSQDEKLLDLESNAHASPAGG